MEQVGRAVFQSRDRMTIEFDFVHESMHLLISNIKIMNFQTLQKLFKSNFAIPKHLIFQYRCEPQQLFQIFQTDKKKERKDAAAEAHIKSTMSRPCVHIIVNNKDKGGKSGEK